MHTYTHTHDDDLRPDVESFVVPGEDAEKRVLQRPLASIMIQYELIILQILRQFFVFHQSPFLLPLLLHFHYLFCFFFLQSLFLLRAFSIKIPHFSSDRQKILFPARNPPDLYCMKQFYMTAICSFGSFLFLYLYKLKS